MSKTGVLSVLVLLPGVVAVLAVSAHGQPQEQVTLRTQPERVVLYAVHRGPYEGLDVPIMQLFHKGAQRGLQLQPQLGVSIAFLNNPDLVEEEHYLTEVRIPVAQGALAHAGTFGDFMDVKKIAPTQVACITKPAGLLEREAYLRRLAAWVARNGYVLVDSYYEVPHGEGADAESEIVFPVRKVGG